jgi:hypothetical protein
MANSYVANPWILDTAGTAVESPYKKSNVDVTEVIWVGYTGDTDTCELQDGNGRTVWIGNGKSDLSDLRSGKLGWIQNGLFLKQLTSGKVYVYIR